MKVCIAIYTTPWVGLVPLMVPLRPSLLLDDKVGEHSEYGVTGFRYTSNSQKGTN